MQPLEFRPLLRRLRWGGRRLGTVLGKPIGPEADYAESWEIADHGFDQTIVLDGPHAGRTLHELVARHAEELLGRHAGLRQFPLLVKFLDASDRLSVQVHPDDRQARRYDPAENGKTEAWVVLAAEPNSRIYAGLRPGVDRARLAAALEAGSVEDCLHSFVPQPGDCVFIPAGTVHAIGEGVLLAEIQQSSDLTFRLFDWGRVDHAGRPRELHIEQALECTDFGGGPCSPVVPRPVPPSLSGNGDPSGTGDRHSSSCDRTLPDSQQTEASPLFRTGCEAEDGGLTEELVRCDQFVIHRRKARRPFTLPRDGRFRILMSVGGSAELLCGSDRRLLTPGRTVLVPAVGEEVYVAPADDAALVEAFLP